MKNKHLDTNWTFPQELEQEIAETLAYFSELKDMDIWFKWGAIAQKSFMLAQPYPRSLFRKKERRRYQIIMKKEFFLENPHFTDGRVPKEVIIGWLGHELGHIVDYRYRSSLNLIWFGIKYFFSKRFLMQAEITADKNAVDRGMIEEIVVSKKFGRNPRYFPEDYIAKLTLFYPSIEMVRGWVEE